MDIQAFYAETLHISNSIATHKMAEATHCFDLEKGDLLIREGEQQTHFVFLIEGVLRGFFLDVNGREITDCFSFLTGTPVMASIMLDQPSAISIEAMTACKLLAVDAQTLEQLLHEYNELLWIYNDLLKRSLAIHWEIKTMICQHTAMERYEWFVHTFPGLVEHVSNKHIASFLGMTPVTLSRLRRTLRDERMQGKPSV